MNPTSNLQSVPVVASSREVAISVRISCWMVLTTLCLLAWAPLSAAEFETIYDVEKQPLVAATNRLIEALQYVGAPLADGDVTRLKAAMQLTKDRESVKAIQDVLDPLCLAQVTINAESRVSVIEGNAPKKLIQQGW
jgi:hypothetical protein